MSKTNILSKTQPSKGVVHVTFRAHDGERTYEYSGAAARGVLKGRDPGAQSGGKLVKHIKKEK